MEAPLGGETNVNFCKTYPAPAASGKWSNFHGFLAHFPLPPVILFFQNPFDSFLFRTSVGLPPFGLAGWNHAPWPAR